MINTQGYYRRSCTNIILIKIYMSAAAHMQILKGSQNSIIVIIIIIVVVVVVTVYET